MRVLLTGSTGRLGGAFLSLWGSGGAEWQVRAVTRGDLDLSKPDYVRSVLDELWLGGEFDVIVNPAAVSGLEQCLDHPELARAVNVDSPREMAEFCKEKGIQMIHFSTDYVFSGDDEGRKAEVDLVGAVNAYGASKYEGETAVLAACPQAQVCRVSWLFGPYGAGQPSHFDHVLERALQGDVQNLIGDKYSVPTFTHDVVRWVEVLLDRGGGGIYHLCNSGEPESWMSYALKVCELAQKHGYVVGIESLKEMSITKAHFFRERRPIHTAMVPARLIDEALVVPRHWLEAAEDYLKIR